MSDQGPQEKPRPGLEDHRDFPRLDVEAKVRLQGVSAEDELHAPAVVSDLSLAGARLTSPAQLEKHQSIHLIPFAATEGKHPLHQALVFEVMWVGPVSPEDGWRQYGLHHQGAVLDVLESWLGHLLLRRKRDEEVILQRRKHRRLRFKEEQNQQLRATISHDRTECEMTLLDVAPGGLLARSELEMPVGIHLEFTEGLIAHDDEREPIYGCVIDSHNQSGSNFYRVSFDPESRVDDDDLVNWAERLGGDLEVM